MPAHQLAARPIAGRLIDLHGPALRPSKNGPLVIVLYGPKAAGKSWVAALLEDRYGVHRVDPDALIVPLVEHGVEPDPKVGWLDQVVPAVLAALDHHDVVSVEATGAWATDWQLPRQLQLDGATVMRVWVTAPVELTLARLDKRDKMRLPVTTEEARRIHHEATARAAHEDFDIVIDTTSEPSGQDVLAAFRAALEPNH